MLAALRNSRDNFLGPGSPFLPLSSSNEIRRVEARWLGVPGRRASPFRPTAPTNLHGSSYRFGTLWIETDRTCVMLPHDKEGTPAVFEAGLRRGCEHRVQWGAALC